MNKEWLASGLKIGVYMVKRKKLWPAGRSSQDNSFLVPRVEHTWYRMQDVLSIGV